jgi:hypothetical protein
MIVIGARAECFPEVLAMLPIPTALSPGHDAGYGFLKLGKYSCAGGGAPTDRPRNSLGGRRPPV